MHGDNHSLWVPQAFEASQGGALARGAGKMESTQSPQLERSSLESGLRLVLLACSAPGRADPDGGSFALNSVELLARCWLACSHQC